MRFELEHLDSYDDSSLLNELRRVAALVHTPKLTIGQFNDHAKVHGSTLQKRFGSWRKTLEAAGLGELFDDSNLVKSRDDLLLAIKATAEKLQQSVLTRQEFVAHTGITDGPVRRVFGSWKAALVAAGLGQSSLGKRYTDEECFENMLALWTHYGRPPQHDEMNRTPSVVGSKAYILRWCTWRKALAAFVERVNQDSPQTPTPPIVHQDAVSLPSHSAKRGTRDIPLGLRYAILKRDRFRCVLDGRSPATDPSIILHVDHIEPWSKGGLTVFDNLRTLCSDCNLGKGASIENI
jgi:hypothetical protein